MAAIRPRQFSTMDHPGASAQRPSCWTGSPNAQGSEAVERNPKTRVKSAIKAGIRRVVRHLPWGVEQAILDAIVAHRGGFRIIGLGILREHCTPMATTA